MEYQLGLLKIPVKDCKESATFYEETFGFTTAFIAEEFGWASLNSDGFYINLYEPGKGGGNRTPGGSVDFHLSLDEASFMPLANRLLEEGKLVENMIHTGADGSTFIEVADLDGNIMKLSKRK